MKLQRLLLAAMVGIAAAVGAGTLMAQWFEPAAVLVVHPSGFYALGDNAFQISATLYPKWHRIFEIRSDQNDHPHHSNAIILEDGKPLGPPHSVHSEIKEKGGGRYSHWMSPTEDEAAFPVLIFSTSDNSDPRINGRRYEIAARPVPSAPFTVCMLALPLLLFALQRLLFPRWDLAIGFIVGISATALAVWVRLFFDQVTIAPDSTSYIWWSFLVPLGYPLFLSGVRSIFGSLGWTGVIQVTLLVCACLVLIFSLKDIVRGRAIELATLLLLLCYVPMFWSAAWLLSEGVFVPLVLLNLAAAFRLIAQQKIRYALILAVTAALILFVRPAGYYIPMGIIFLLAAQRGRARWMLKWACLPFAVCLATTFLVNAGVRGNSTPSQMGRLLFATVTFLFEPQFGAGPYQELVPAIEDGLKPHRDGYTKASGQAARVAYSMNDYNARLIAMDQALDQKCAASGRRCLFEMKESLYLSFFMSTIVNRPVAYLNLVVEQIVESWRTSILTAYEPFRSIYLAEANDLPTRLDQIQKQGLPLSGEEVRLRPDLLDSFAGQFVEALDTGYQTVREQRWLVYLIGIVTLIAIPIAMFFRRDSNYWLALGYCGVMIHGSMLLTAAVTVFIRRYALPVDPIILMSGAIMIGGPISWSLSRIEQFEAVTIGRCPRITMSGYSKDTTPHGPHQ